MEYIKIENYRCFQNLEMELGMKITLLVGDNASGKTTLLTAIRSALSAFFLGYSDENTRFIGLSKKDFTQISTDTSILNEKPIRITFDYGDYTSLRPYEADATIALQTVKSRTSYSEASAYKRETKQLYNSLFNELGFQRDELPLFACFSTEDIHSSRRLDKKRFRAYKNKPSLGYYECLQADGLFPYWLERLLVLAEKDPNHPEIECVREAIKAALGSGGCNIIEDMSVRPIKREVFYHFIDGREVSASNLSDGYRRLVNIVTDLAFRAALLNYNYFHHHNYSVKITRNVTHGTVLIDEIDLHLHPTLQACVVKGLRNAFPALQFIISTHAPMVMTGIEPSIMNIVYKMDYSQEEGYTQRKIQTYGLDASTIIDVTLDQTPRDKVVQEQLNELFDLIDEDKFAQAKEKLQQMRDVFGNALPELTKAETMLNLLCGTPDEKDC